jgi:hypothetical protein
MILVIGSTPAILILWCRMRWIRFLRFCVVFVDFLWFYSFVVLPISEPREMDIFFSSCAWKIKSIIRVWI